MFHSYNITNFMMEILCTFEHVRLMIQFYLVWGKRNKECLGAQRTQKWLSDVKGCIIIPFTYV